MMPPKYGAPFRCSAIEENNKIVLNLLGMDSSGKLYKGLPNTLAENIEKYLPLNIIKIGIKKLKLEDNNNENKRLITIKGADF